ncbi:MAG: hypothetical protein U1A28_04185, partial [Patescibacteria group bacterium]|nr:hypothetical protein [Patescibacteria group bacterium]
MALSFFKKPECEICRNPNAKDVLVTPVLGGKATRQKVCRVHFLDGYKKAFTAHPFKMVVTYPILDTWNSTYGFYSVSEMKAYAYQDDDVTMVKKLLALIPAGQECAFFGLEPSKKATLE